MTTANRHQLPGRSSPATPTAPSRAIRNLSAPWRGALTAVLALALLFVAACAPGSQGNGSSSSGATTLRVSTWGNDSRVKLTQQAIDAFTKANPDIVVKLENSEWGSYWDKLATSTAGGDSPDVIQMDESYIAAYGSRGALLVLDTVKTDLDLSAMNSKVLDTGKVGGTLVGAPIGTANFSVGVNPTVLQEAGVKMPDDKTWTWDDRTLAGTIESNYDVGCFNGPPGSQFWTFALQRL